VNVATPPASLLRRLYVEMLRVRVFEERVDDLYARAMIPGIAHLSIGQEASAVGVCGALEPADYITSTHRGHGHCLAKGADPARMFAELLGRETGYCGGKGGSMHIADPATGNLGANAIVGGSLGIATGAGLSAKLRGSGQVVACFLGDGALNQGLLLETMNMAALWRLPVIYACEDNQYGEYSHRSSVTAGDVLLRGEALGIASERVDGMDVTAVHGAASAAVARGRAGDGPTFLLCDTYRYHGHGMSDRNRAYRERDEEAEWRRRDPVEGLERDLRARSLATDEELAAWRRDVEAEMDAAVETAKAADLPTIDALEGDVYVA
jgi:pyruvate dehydrogenase E1 component alpha subunit